MICSISSRDKIIALTLLKVLIFGQSLITPKRRD